MPDIDIDFQPNFDINTLIKSAVPASRVDKGVLVKHNCGQYFQAMPVDLHTKLAAIPYEEADVLGYFKIDFLKLTTLNNFVSKDEIRELIKHEPDWDLLLNEDHVEKLSQVRKHSVLLKQIRPRSVLELADCIALIRPSKKHLVLKYANCGSSGRKQMRDDIYSKPSDDKAWFKKAHSIAYALTIVLEMHLIAAGVL